MKLMITNYKIIIGIDTGTNTGFAVWSKPEKCFLEISTLLIHIAMQRVIEYNAKHGDDLFVRFEDARLRKWFEEKSKFGVYTAKDKESLQGAGSIKRDCKIWEDFLTDKRIAFASVAPRSAITKMQPDKFKLYTGWAERTSNHARDAAMLVYGY